MKKICFVILVCSSFLFLRCGFAEDLLIRVHSIDEKGKVKEIGTVAASDSAYGLLLKPNLTDLPPGLHGFHVHQNASCESDMKDGKMTAGAKAGGHFDPKKTEKHEGPYGEGHLGDLPGLYVNQDGKATTPVLAPRLKVSDLKGHSLMIHKGGDNYSDQPEKLGGGGARIACGVIE
jgi:superoxide dismutase, Cu-Zn family